MLTPAAKRASSNCSTVSTGAPTPSASSAIPRSSASLWAEEARTIARSAKNRPGQLSLNQSVTDCPAFYLACIAEDRPPASKSPSRNQASEAQCSSKTQNGNITAYWRRQKSGCWFASPNEFHNPSTQTI